MKKRLWVVEVCYPNGDWAISTYNKLPYASTKFTQCHKLKRDIQSYLITQGTKRKLRVIEYKGT